MSRIVTPEAILSYPNLVVPRAQQEGKQPKYSCTLVFPDGTDVRALKKAALDVAKAKWGTKLEGAKIKVLDTQYGPANFLVSPKVRIRLPWRDAPEDVAKKGYPEGSTFVNVSSQRAPGIVTLIPDPNTGKPMKLTDDSKLYPGAIVRASIDPYAYDTSGNLGVTFGLGNIQWVRDGERLDGSVSAADEFDADASAVADLGDLDEAGDEDDGLADLIG